jgi:hypothetical protein
MQLNERQQNKARHRPPLPCAALASILGAIAVGACFLSSCVSIGTPRPGQPVVIHRGEALVFGRIRMLGATNENIEYSPFWFDPWDQPFFAPGPRMTLELRQLFSPGGMFRYKAHPTPPIETDGSFFWILSAGDYELLGNPRLYGSKRFTQEETTPLARFSVPTTGGTIYVGTLIISIDYSLENYVLAWRKGEAEYEIRTLRVVDDRERNLSKLRERFPALPEPVVTEYMSAE